MRFTEHGDTGDLIAVGRAGVHVSPPSAESDRIWQPWSVRANIINVPSLISTIPGSCIPVLLPAGPSTSPRLWRQVAPLSSDKKQTTVARVDHGPPALACRAAGTTNRPDPSRATRSLLTTK